jgi:hypothetical protein
VSVAGSLRRTTVKINAAGVASACPLLKSADVDD